jgi:hypothetical protein
MQARGILTAERTPTLRDRVRLRARRPRYA